MSLPEYTTLNMSAPIVASFYAFFLLKEKINIYLILSLLLDAVIITPSAPLLFVKD